MRFTSDKTRRAAEDFKEAILQLQERHDITDKELSAILGVSIMTISRWENQMDECHLPAFTLGVFPRIKKYEDFVIALLRLLAAKYEHDVVRDPKAGDLNGRLDDEIMESVKELGKLSEYAILGHDHAKELMVHAEALIQLGYRMKAEIESKVKK